MHIIPLARFTASGFLLVDCFCALLCLPPLFFIFGYPIAYAFSKFSCCEDLGGVKWMGKLARLRMGILMVQEARILFIPFVIPPHEGRSQIG